jgi:hypothetical protein
VRVSVRRQKKLQKKINLLTSNDLVDRISAAFPNSFGFGFPDTS